ncbi:MAG: glycosyltransferase family 4 protein [Coriobacteriia bacterium]
MGQKVRLNAPWGFNVIGFITGNFGLASAARNTVRTLDRRDIPMRIVDIDVGSDRSGKDFSCMHMGQQTLDPVPYAVNLFHMNPHEVDRVVGSPDLRVGERINVCVPFWELPVLPRDWRPVLVGVDIVLAPTEFIRESIQSAFPEALCIPYPQAAIVPTDVAPKRCKWGLPEDAVVFLNVFDLHSDIMRKNPLAVVEAFRRAFPNPENEYLVVKMSASASARAQYPNELALIHSVAAETPHLILIDELLPYEDVLALHASCDVLVSLHRSEGLGLNLMEAMTYGKPVICTAWSGNMDFSTEDNSCLVGYELIPVAPTHTAYRPETLTGQAFWADPSVDEAAGHMERLARDARLRTCLGQQAKADMEERVRKYWRGLVFDQIKQQALDAGSDLWAGRSRR